MQLLTKSSTIIIILLSLQTCISSALSRRTQTQQCAYHLSPSLPPYFHVVNTMQNYTKQIYKQTPVVTAQCSEKAEFCMVLWEYNERNETRVFLKGCWLGERWMCRVNGSSDSCIATDSTYVQQHDKTLYFCCCHTPNCNQRFQFRPDLAEKKPDRKTHVWTKDLLDMPAASPTSWSTVIMGTLTITIVSFTVIALTLLCCKRSTVQLMVYLKLLKHYDENDEEINRGDKDDGSKLLLMGRECCTSHSEYQDVSHLTLCELIGTGRYGRVYRAVNTTQKSTVAVKIIQSADVATFKNEWLKYKELGTSEFLPSFHGVTEMKHETGGIERREYWLMTEYMSNGSLQSYLKSHTYSFECFCRMAHSLTSALAFLHSHHNDSHSIKLPVAHRDLNSKNVLVKADAVSLVICDLGLSRTMPGYEHDMGVMSAGCSRDTPVFAHGLGTARYMAPEVLEGAVNLRDSSAALREIDVYAVGLILWELMTRCEQLYDLQGTPLPCYSSPYTRELPAAAQHHPTIQQMQLCVCRHKSRPLFPQSVLMLQGQIQVLGVIRELVEDCWDQDAEARISAECARERLADLFEADIKDRQQVSIHQVNNYLQVHSAEHEVNQQRDVLQLHTLDETLLQKYTLQPYQAANPSLERNTLKLQGRNNHRNEESVANETCDGYCKSKRSEDSSCSCSCSQSHDTTTSTDDNTPTMIHAQKYNRKTTSSFRKVDPCDVQSLATHLLNTREQTGTDNQQKCTNEQPTERLLVELLGRIQSEKRVEERVDDELDNITEATPTKGSDGTGPDAPSSSTGCPECQMACLGRF